MRKTTFLATTFCLANAGAIEPAPIPDSAYPRLAAQAASVQGFVPAGWALEKSVEGDLDRDGRADLAFVLREKNPAHVISNEGLGESRLDTNPRILAVAFATGSPPGLRLVLQDHALIPRHDMPTIDDPFDDLSIRKGVLRVSLRFWVSAGSWTTSTTSFAFRHEGGCFRLIGHDHWEMHRASLDTTERSVNFLTGKVKLTEDNGAQDKKGAARVRWTRLADAPPICLREVGDGFAFDPEAAGGARR